MIYIQKKGEPAWLADFRRKYPQASYDSKEFEGYKGQLRQELSQEQHNLCAYCCCDIGSGKSHNEHIEPRNPGTYTSRRSLDYYNLVASCNGFGTEETCGAHKKNFYDKKRFVSPLNPDCEEKFTYFPDGKIEGDDYTISLLNLDARGLQNARKAVYRMLQGMDLEEIRAVFLSDLEHPVPFINVIRWYVREYEA